MIGQVIGCLLITCSVHMCVFWLLGTWCQISPLTCNKASKLKRACEQCSFSLFLCFFAGNGSSSDEEADAGVGESTRQLLLTRSIAKQNAAQRRLLQQGKEDDTQAIGKGEEGKMC